MIHEKDSMTSKDFEREMTKSEYINRKKKERNSCAAYLKRFDTLIMRPLFIYEYQMQMLKKKDEFLEMFMKEGDLWEKIYSRNQESIKDLRNNSILEHIRTRSVLTGKKERPTVSIMKKQNEITESLSFLSPRDA